MPAVETPVQDREERIGRSELPSLPSPELVIEPRLNGPSRLTDRAETIAAPHGRAPSDGGFRKVAEDRREVHAVGDHDERPELPEARKLLAPRTTDEENPPARRRHDRRALRRRQIEAVEELGLPGPRRSARAEKHGRFVWGTGDRRQCGSPRRETRVSRLAGFQDRPAALEPAEIDLESLGRVD